MGKTSNTLFDCDRKEFLYNDLINLLGDKCKLLSTHKTSECIDIVLKYDETITYYCNRFAVSKELVQTILLRELWTLSAQDTATDAMVRTYFNYKCSYEDWENLPTVVRMLTSPPQPAGIMLEDCSTGIGQMYAYVAINAHNLAIDNRLISGNKYNSDDWHHIYEFWCSLNNDDYFAIKMITLELYHCAEYANVFGPLYNLTENQIKAILSRYNGTGDAAVNYGKECYEYYKIFKKYS